MAKRRFRQCLAPKILDPFLGRFRVLPQCQLIFIGSCNACRLAAFSQKMRFKVSKFFFLQVGMKVYVPPLPAFAVQQQIAAVRRQTVGNVVF